MKNTILVLVAIAAIAIAGCSPAVQPAPTPEIQTVTVEVPGPQPTPQIITKTVEVPGPTVYLVPDVCYEAIMGLGDLGTAENDMLGRYAEGKQPTNKQINAFLDINIDAVFNDVTDCLNLWAEGDVSTSS